MNLSRFLGPNVKVSVCQGLIENSPSEGKGNHDKSHGKRIYLVGE